MKRFEVYYHDKTIPGPMFMVVVKGVNPYGAMTFVKDLGYLPIRVCQLKGGK